MNSISYRRALCATVATLTMAIGAGPALAQQSGDASAPKAARTPAADAYAQTNSMDIVVTARKRQESLLNVPVIENIVPAVQLQRLQTNDLKDLTKLAPGLLLGSTVLSIGEQVSIRGIGTTSFDPGIDQSVSLNLDGLALGQGLAYSSGLFDVGQVEVLKGPQALFFGKSSPGGVISLRTADPTDKFELIARGGYEFEARQRRGELIVSGPVTDTLKARLAGMYSATQGFYYNRAIADPGTGAATPRYGREGRSRDYQIRGTILWDPTPQFSARIKLNLAHDYTVDADNFQYTSCPDGISPPPLGIPFIGGGEDCKLNRTARVVDYDPAAFQGITNNGVPYVRILQRYGTMELNYRPNPDITVTSVTGYYNLHSSSLTNTSDSTFAGPNIAAQNPKFRRHDFTQELRVNTDLKSPVNFSMGAFYQDAKVLDHIQVLSNQDYFFGPVDDDGNPTRLPPVLSDGLNQFRIKTYSVYGQIRWQIVPQLELAAGARLTDERRTENPFNYLTGLPTIVPTSSIHSRNGTPEVTLTYKPNDDLTIFGAFKKGYKSGSFSIATPAVTGVDNSFGDERVQGGEAGVKGRLFDRQVNFSFSGYDYLYKGLQVGAIEPTVNNIPVIRTINAGSARVYGLEFDLGYQPIDIPGLSLNGAVNWTHARFKKLDNVPCYGGQTVAAGCTGFPNPTTLDPETSVPLNTAQDLSGTPLVRAPDWQVNFGFDYQLPVGGGMNLILTSSNAYTSSYRTALALRDDITQNAFFKSDLSLTLQGPHDRWEFAVIGKNITNRLTRGNCAPSNFAGGLLPSEVTGGTSVGPAGVDEVGCYMDPGRELWLRLTLKPFN